MMKNDSVIINVEVIVKDGSVDKKDLECFVKEILEFVLTNEFVEDNVEVNIMGKRFEVRKCGLVYKLFDTKIDDFLDVCADYDTLMEVARICNNLERKNQCCQKKCEVLMKFADPVEVNKYWESMTDG